MLEVKPTEVAKMATKPLSALLQKHSQGGCINMLLSNYHQQGAYRYTMRYPVFCVLFSMGMTTCSCTCLCHQAATMTVISTSSHLTKWHAERRQCTYLQLNIKVQVARAGTSLDNTQHHTQISLCAGQLFFQHGKLTSTPALHTITFGFLSCLKIQLWLTLCMFTNYIYLFTALTQRYYINLAQSPSRQ